MSQSKPEHDVAAGRVCPLRFTDTLHVRGVWPGQAGQEREIGWLQQSAAHDFSSDGKTLLMSVTGEAVGPNYGSCIRRMDGGAPVFLGEGFPLALSPDGKRVLSLMIHPVRQFVLVPTGAGSAQPLNTGDLQVHSNADWLPDNRHIVFDASQPGRPRRLYTMALESGAITPVTPEGYSSSYQAHIVSQDGKSLLTVNAEGDLFVQQIAGGMPRPLPGAQRGDAPMRWSADGSSVYLETSHRLPFEVVKLNVTTGIRTHFKTLGLEDQTGVRGLAALTAQVSADGSAYAYTYFRDLYDLYLVDGLR